MSEITVRTATLDDAAAITAIHTSHIERWQRLNAQGQVEDVPYAKLTVYERWLHGGPWMTVEMGAVYLTHLLRGAGTPLVAEIDGAVLANAEVYRSVEPKPFGDHLNVSVLHVHRDHTGAGLGSALLERILVLGRELGCARVTTTQPEAPDFYAKFGFRTIASLQNMTFPVKSGQVFYQATPHPADDPAQIQGWMMPLGRYQSARQEWVTRWTDLWIGVPEIQARRIERFRFTMGPANFFVMYEASSYDSRRAQVRVWTSTALTGPMLTAISDRAHKIGFRRLDAYVVSSQPVPLGPDAEPDGYPLDVWGVAL